jgi:hypothetical protein
MLLGVVVSGGAGCSGGNPEIPAAVQAKLRRASNCDDLLASLKADASRKMNDSIDASIAALRRWNPYGWNELSADAAAQAGPADSAGARGGDSARSFSQTNNQVKGVDEADFVKNDGKYIYLLHGQKFEIVQAWPADQMAPASSIDIEGYPQEMFVDSGRAVIFSAVDASPIYAAAGVKERSRYQDWYGGYGIALAGGGDAVGGAPAPDCFGCGYGIYGGLTKVTVLSLADVSQPKVIGENYFEGSYLSSRRIGTRVRTVLNGGAHGPAIEYWPSDLYESRPYNWVPTQGDMIQAYERLRQKNQKLIDASTIADWLPYVFSKSNGAITAQLERCEDYMLPSAGSTSWGLTQIASVDMAAPEASPKILSVVGQTDTIYSSTNEMVLAQHGWMPYAWYWQYDTPPDGITLDYTHLHAFALDRDLPSYVGSGTIRGNILDQFSLDEKDGILRVTSTEHRTKRSLQLTARGFQTTMQTEMHNHLVTLRPNGSELVQIGQVPEIAQDERIYSTRFVGDRAYVVTFRQVDPLFVIDLKDPAHPAILGSVTIPGFSTYMHPLDETHLLTIGRDVDPNTNRQGQLMLQIFDVTNATAPALAQKYVYDSGSWGYSEAQYNHKAFNYFSDKQLLSFPFYAYNQSGAHSSAELFKIDINSGITKLGSVDHTSFIGTSYSGWCGGYFSPEVRRTVFMDDILYSISYGGVIATDTKTMGTVSILPLEAPRYDGYAGCR